MTDKATEQEGATGADRLAELVERYHQLARRTQNPMYAWLALQALLEAGVDASGEWPIQQQLPMPGWIADYLLLTTRRLSSLAAGVDYRAGLPPPAFLSMSNDPETMRDEYLKSEEFRQQMEVTQVSFRDAMKAVPAALGLTRDGWNAFSSLEATTQKMQEANAYAAMKATGVPEKVALHAIGSEIGVKDPSYIHTRLRDGESLLADDDEGKPGV